MTWGEREARVESEGGGGLPSWQELRQSQAADQLGQETDGPMFPLMFNSMRRRNCSGLTRRMKCVFITARG
jgi:hypothetical protein